MSHKYYQILYCYLINHCDSVVVFKRNGWVRYSSWMKIRILIISGDSVRLKVFSALCTLLPPPSPSFWIISPVLINRTTCLSILKISNKMWTEGIRTCTAQTLIIGSVNIILCWNIRGKNRVNPKDFLLKYRGSKIIFIYFCEYFQLQAGASSPYQALNTFCSPHNWMPRKTFEVK